MVFLLHEDTLAQGNQQQVPATSGTAAPGTVKVKYKFTNNAQNVVVKYDVEAPWVRTAGNGSSTRVTRFNVAYKKNLEASTPLGQTNLLNNTNVATADESTWFDDATMDTKGLSQRNIAHNISGTFNAGDEIEFSWSIPQAGTPNHSGIITGIDNFSITGDITGTTAIAAGTYNVAVTDANGCTKTGSTTVTTNPAATASIGASTNAVCKDATSPTVTLTGGTAQTPYTITYTVNDGTNTTSSAVTTTGMNTSVDVNVPTGTVGTFTYTITSIQDGNGCVTNFTTSPPTVSVTVNPLTSITTQPVTNTYCQDAAATALSVAASGTPTITYEWFSNTMNSNTGGTSVGSGAIYTPLTTTAGSKWYYAVATSSACGSATSDAVEIKVNPLTEISTQPIANTYCQDAPATALSVAAIGTGTISYEWFSNTSNSNTGGTSVGTGSSFTPPTTTAGSIWYYAVATSSICGSTTSNAVEIKVNPRPTSVVSGGGAVCPTAALPDVSIALTGTGPWTFTYNPGSVTVTATSSNPYIVANAAVGTYTVTALSDANCTALPADRTGSAVVSVRTSPSVAIVVTKDACNGSDQRGCQAPWLDQETSHEPLLRI